MSNDTLLVLRSWSWDPLLWLALLIAAAAYVGGFYYYHRRGQLAALKAAGQIKAAQPWYFAAFLLTIFIALQSPLDGLSGQLFVMHMSQHLVLALVAAPLFLLALPAAFVDPLISWHPHLKSLMAGLTHPFAAFLIFNLTLVAWHIPAVYEAALRSEPVHNLEHAMFFWTAVLSWWPLLSPSRLLPRISYAAQILYLFLVPVPAAVLGAWLIFAQAVVYPTYAGVPAVWGLSALDDQQLGATMMMVPGKFIYFIVLTIIFFRWFNQDETPVNAERRPLPQHR